MRDDVLTFSRAPNDWNDGLPAGSGRLATMLWEHDGYDILSLNNENLWSGNFKDRQCQQGAVFLPHVREFLKQGEHFKATALAAVAFGGNGGISPLIRRMDSYQPAFDLLLGGLGKTVGRKLFLDRGVALVEKEQGFITSFCHLKQDCSVILIEGKITDLSISAVRKQQEGFRLETLYTDSSILLIADAGKGVSWKAFCTISSDGVLKVEPDGITISKATFAMIVMDIKSEREAGEATANIPQNRHAFLSLHQSYFSSIMQQCRISLEDNDTQTLSSLSIEQRIARMREGFHDPQLIALYARFGVYLMVCGSTTATLPLNLQGKWNHSTFPKWNSDYHLNINLQMNYWCTDRLQMYSYTRQMLEYVESLMDNARIAAERLYGCRGIMLALNSDIWRNITAEAYNYAVWIGGAGWFATHFYNHYATTGDKAWLREKAWPFIRETARFYADYIVLSDEGICQIMPSQSPENRFEGGGYFPVTNCINSAMDLEICHDALQIAIQSARTLDIENQETEHWRELLSRLPKPLIASDGRLVEWDTEKRIELEKGHRHFSHLYGVYPSSQFTPEKDVERFKACRKSLDVRLASGGGHTGWSLAWGACLYARFLDGLKVEEELEKLITTLSSASLLDLHPDYHPMDEPPKKGKDNPFIFSENRCTDRYVFQIDGNLGAVAALIEALVQERDGIIYLMPAVSKHWAKGTSGPISVKSGGIVDFDFENGRVTRLALKLGHSRKMKLSIHNKIKEYQGKEGEEFVVTEL